MCARCVWCACSRANVCVSLIMVVHLLSFGCGACVCVCVCVLGERGSGHRRLAARAQVQRTMLELLNQMDGFASDTRIKVIAATNRPDTLDPALLRSGAHAGGGKGAAG